MTHEEIKEILLLILDELQDMNTNQSCEYPADNIPDEINQITKSKKTTKSGRVVCRWKV